MPRVLDMSRANQSGGFSLFQFQGGKARVVGFDITNHKIPAFTETSCGLLVTLQPLDANWNPTNSEPVSEFVLGGDVQYVNQQTGETEQRWHPGIAANRDDTMPDLGNAGDLGNEEGPEEYHFRGNVVLSHNGKAFTKHDHPKNPSPVSVLLHSMEEAGVKNTLISHFYTPDFIGLEAEFTRLMSGRVSKEKGNQITQLIVGKDGKATGGAALVHKYPVGQVGGATLATQPAATRQSTAPPPPEPWIQAPALSPASNPALTDDADAADREAIRCLEVVGKLKAGTPIQRTKLWAAINTKLFKPIAQGGLEVPAALHPGVKARVTGQSGFEGWLAETVEEEDWPWTLTGKHEDGSVSIPAGWTA